MLLQNQTTKCPWCWRLGLVGGLLSLVVLLAGVTWQARATAAETPKKAEKKEEKKAEPKPLNPTLTPGLQNLDEVLKSFRAVGMNDDQLKEAEKQMREGQKRLLKMMQQLQQRGLPAMPPMPMVIPAMPGGLWAVPGGVGTPSRLEPRLGAQVRKPSATLADQLDLPKNQGLVLEEVGPNSAAAKAGLKQHDILLELKGKAVSSKPEELIKALEGIKPTDAVDAVVLRKGKKETIKGLTLPEVKTQVQGLGRAGFPGFPAPQALRLGGIGLVGSTSISRNNDDFTAKNTSGNVTITLKGKIVQGKAVVSEVKIDEGQGKAKTYESLDKVPADYKATAKKLAEMSGGARIQLQLP